MTATFAILLICIQSMFLQKTTVMTFLLEDVGDGTELQIYYSNLHAVDKLRNWQLLLSVLSGKTLNYDSVLLL